MGATLSNLTEGSNGAATTTGPGPGLGDIPESCVACVFMYLTPPEICNLARLNRAFRGAALSDSVWEAKLPPNYQDLLSLMLPLERYESLSKKDIFALLSRSVPFDDEGNKVVWLDRVTGGLCMAVSAKAMVITGIDDRRYWSWVPTEESRRSVVEYQVVSWTLGVRYRYKSKFFKEERPKDLAGGWELRLYKSRDIFSLLRSYFSMARND